MQIRSIVHKTVTFPHELGSYTPILSEIHDEAHGPSPEQTVNESTLGRQIPKQ